MKQLNFSSTTKGLARLRFLCIRKIATKNDGGGGDGGGGGGRTVITTLASISKYLN